MDSDPVTLTLTRDEALVLFEFLARCSKAETLPIIDQAEEVALWRLEGMLESRLVEIVMPNYSELVQHARDRLRDAC